jgi:hypothetical protein
MVTPMTGSDATSEQVRIGRWPHAIVACAPLLAVAVTLARSIRPPDTFAATQAMFTCDLAPKRCAFGQTLALLHIPAGHFAIYSTVSTILLVAVVALYGLAIVRSRLAASTVGLVMAASLAASFGFGVFVALNGSLDVPMAILAAAGLLAPRQLQGPTIAVAAVLGVLVHEAYLVIFLPTAMLPLVLRVERVKDLIAPVAISGAVLAVTVLCALNRPLTHDQADHLLKLLQTKADFPLQGYGLAVLHRSLADNLAMMGEIARTPWFWSLQLANAALLAPVAGLFVCLVYLGWRAPARAKLATIAAAAAPLSMNILGYDVLRWGGLCTLAMALSLCALAARYGAPRLTTPLFPGCAALFAVVPLLLPAPYSHQVGAPAQVEAILQQS